MFAGIAEETTLELRTANHGLFTVMLAASHIATNREGGNDR